MTFPKLVVHSALAGLYGGLVVLLLLRLANPVAGHETWSLTTWLFVVLGYALASAIMWPVLYATLRFFASHRLRLGWLSPRYLIGFNAVNTAALLVAGWLMLSENRSSLSPKDAHRLANACGWLTMAWLAGVIAATVPGLRRRPRAQAGAGLLSLLALLAVFPRTWSGGQGPPSPSRPPGDAETSETAPSGTSPARRVVLLNFDGADLDTILTMQAQGKLPGFSRLVEGGSYGRLSSLEPCLAAVTRTTLVTGMLPYRNGVRGPQARSVLGRSPWLEVVPPGLGFDVLLAPVLERHVTSVADRLTPSLWEISARLGGVGEAAGWEVDLDLSPKEEALTPASSSPQDWLSELLDPEVQRQKEPRTRALVHEITRAAAADAEVLESLSRFEADGGRGVIALSFPGLDRVAHVFLRYARPADFGNVSPRDIELFGPVLERYYRRIDGIVGRVLQHGAPGSLLLVSSTHGMEPAPPLRRLKEEILGGEHWSGLHHDAPPGFLFVHGQGARRAWVFGKGSIADVAPTALYALDLPVARNADGNVLAGAFSEAFTLSHPVTVIGRYDLQSD